MCQMVHGKGEELSPEGSFLREPMRRFCCLGRGMRSVPQALSQAHGRHLPDLNLPEDKPPGRSGKVPSLQPSQRASAEVCEKLEAFPEREGGEGSDEQKHKNYSQRAATSVSRSHKFNIRIQDSDKRCSTMSPPVQCCYPQKSSSRVSSNSKSVDDARNKGSPPPPLWNVVGIGGVFCPPLQCGM